MLVEIALQAYETSFPGEHSNPWQVSAALMVVLTLCLVVYVHEYMVIYVEIDKI